VGVAGTDALTTARALAKQEGIFAGITSGATLAAAISVAKRAPRGSKVLCMLPDTGERYLSTPLCEDLAEEMTKEEVTLSKSPPNVGFVVSPPLPPTDPEDEAPAIVTPEARAFLDAALASKDEPVVLFALEWCEFCWSVRKLFGQLGIAYRSIDLDSVEFQANDFGGKIRAVLAEKTGAVTIPQIFIGGKHIGGCTELFDAVRAGSIQKQLEKCGAGSAAHVNIDPYTLLPKWLHPRKSA